jgi:hypothetical protein
VRLDAARSTLYRLSARASPGEAAGETPQDVDPAMDILLHPADDADRHRPTPGGRLSTVGHAAAWRAFARVAKRAGIRFMVIGGTYRDVAFRAASTRDIDIVLVDCDELPADLMRQGGFVRAPRSRHAWRYVRGEREVALEIAAVARSSAADSGEPGPFSVAFRHAETRTIEGIPVGVPRLEDYVVLKLIAAAADRRRWHRDLADVQYALDGFPERARTSLSLAAIQARLRDEYEVRGEQLKALVALRRECRPPGRRP